MNYIKTYKQHNEGIKSAIAGAGLAASLLTSPGVSANPDSIKIEYSVPQDGTVVYKQVEEISKLRSQKSKDDQLALILDEIKSNINSTDSSKYLELFDKLSTHLKNKYNYKFEQRDPNQLDESSIGELRSDNSKAGLLSIIGWLGSICLAICGVPQAWTSYKDRHSHGISWAFLLLWAFGEIFALAYVYDKLDLPLLMNYSVNILILSIILYFKLKPQVEADPDLKPRSGH